MPGPEGQTGLGAKPERVCPIAFGRFACQGYPARSVAALEPGQCSRASYPRRMRDSLLSLPDGRSLAYTELGATDGPAVMYFHGAPTSRLDLATYDAEFVRRGLRVISPDRPGYGGSTPQPGRRLESWPTDMARLADHLLVETFACIGYSSGGPYALACAALLPDRVITAGVVAGVTDMGWEPAWVGFDKPEAELMAIGDETEAAAWCEAKYGAHGERFLDGEPDLPPADMAALADGSTSAGMFESVGESFRQGVIGYAQDVTVQGRPWTFDLAAAKAHVTVVHGDADTVVPTAHARHTVEVLPNASLVLLPEEWHFSIYRKIPDVIADLLSAAG
jgi:pimeloyl-ACP methyl ester carboxylesterase